MKPDERDFLAAYCQLTITTPLPYCRPCDVPMFGEIDTKRMDYILEKWARRDWYDYGTAIWGGWLTELGKHAAEALLASANSRS